MKKTDALREFNALREALAAEKAELESRLQEIDQALGTTTSYQAPSPRGGYTGGGRRGNPGSLKAMVLQVTKDKPLSRSEILDAVLKAGYKFKAKDPLNSLGTTLYTSKEIKSYGRGVFGPA